MPFLSPFPYLHGDQSDHIFIVEMLLPLIISITIGTCFGVLDTVPTPLPASYP